MAYVALSVNCSEVGLVANSTYKKKGRVDKFPYLLPRAIQSRTQGVTEVTNF